MFKRSLIVKLLCIVLVLLFLWSSPVLAADASELTPGEAKARFEVILDLYLENHYLPKEKSEVLQATIEKMLEEYPSLFDEIATALLSSGDPYGYYMTAEMKAQLEEREQGNGGIGVIVIVKDDYVTVSKVSSNSPAWQAGILPGDRIVEVDGQDVRNCPISQLSKLVRGRVGTAVNIGILRDQETQVRYFTIIRAKLNESAVSHEEIADTGIYRVRVANFISDGVDEDFFYTIQDILGQQDYKGLIVDVRSNPGGDFYACLNMINMLIPQKNKPLCYARDSKGNRDAFYSTGEMFDTKKCAILVDKNTASAAELFAKSLQQNGIAKVFGKKTYGKAIGQSSFDLDDGSSAYITTFEVLSPNGSRYNDIGVIPDYSMDNREVPIQLPEFMPLNNKNYFTAVINSTNDAVLAVEQRLSYLGYIIKADRYFDGYTATALKNFQKDMDIKQTGKVDWSTLVAFTNLFNEIKTLTQTEDIQLQTAISYINGELK